METREEGIQGKEGEEEEGEEEKSIDDDFNVQKDEEDENDLDNLGLTVGMNGV